MMSRTPKLVALMAPFVFGMTVPACPDGMDPLTLELSDASGGGCESDGGLTKPFATGARLDIDARHNGALLSVTDVTLADPAVWSIIDAANPVALRAESAGSSVITVRSAEGREGTATLEVADIAKATISPWSGIQPFNLTVELGAGPTDIAKQLTQSGFALLPDGELRLQVLLEDAQSRELGGYDVAGWEASPAGAVTIAGAEERTNDVTVTHAGGAPDDVTITTVGGGSFTFALVDSGAATSLEAFNVDTGETGTSLSIPAGATRTIVALVYDAAGRWLVGHDGQKLNVTLENDGVVSVVPPPWSEGEDAIELDDVALQLLDDNRVFYLKGFIEGTTIITVSAAGVQLDIPVTVTAPGQ